MYDACLFMVQLCLFSLLFLTTCVLWGSIFMAAYDWWAGRKKTPDIFSPELDRDLIESLDSKCARLLELMEKSGVEVQDLERWQSLQVDAHLELEKRVESLEERATEAEWQKAPDEDVDWQKVTDASWTPAFQVDGPLPVSSPLSTTLSDWDAYLQMVDREREQSAIKKGMDEQSCNLTPNQKVSTMEKHE